ncbi:MAG: hypothetical protein QM710_02865 [Flavobacterium sp.]
MKTFRIICLMACIIIIGFHLYSIDYEDLRFKTNATHYLGIFAMVLIGLSMLLGIIKDRKPKE